eukprot:scaffold847_cov385-Prasinococcus_capsulatus_cf.AAC.8
MRNMWRSVRPWRASPSLQPSSLHAFDFCHQDLGVHNGLNFARLVPCPTAARTECCAGDKIRGGPSSRRLRSAPSGASCSL